MSRQTRYDKVKLLGVEVDEVTIEQAINYIVEWAGDRGRSAGYVVKPYVEFMDQAARDPELRRLLDGAELCLADGVALIWAAHYLYAGARTNRRFIATLAQIITAPQRLQWPLPQKFAGTNFTLPLMKAAAAADLSVYLIGDPTDSRLDDVAAALHRQIPRLKIVGQRSGRDPKRPRGHVGDAWLAATLAELRQARPSIVLVGMGFPLQEQVMARLAPELSHGVLIGEGGTFDYAEFGGRRRKAPAVLQRAGLEWLWRLALQPARLKRQLAIPRYISAIWRSR